MDVVVIWGEAVGRLWGERMLGKKAEPGRWTVEWRGERIGKEN